MVFSPAFFLAYSVEQKGNFLTQTNLTVRITSVVHVGECYIIHPSFHNIILPSIVLKLNYIVRFLKIFCMPYLMHQRQCLHARGISVSFAHRGKSVLSAVLRKGFSLFDVKYIFSVENSISKACSCYKVGCEGL